MCVLTGGCVREAAHTDGIYQEILYFLLLKLFLPRVDVFSSSGANPPLFASD